MGVSTDAILFYGYAWDEETDEPWTIGGDDEESDDKEEDEDDDDWETRYARLKGVPEPDEKFPDKGYDKHGSPIKNYTPEEQAIVDKFLAYWDAKRNVVEEAICEVGTHCMSDCPMPYVCIKSTYICNSRGDYTRLTAEQFEVDPSWDSELKKFCKLMGIPLPAEGPGWFMVSRWS